MMKRKLSVSLTILLVAIVAGLSSFSYSQRLQVTTKGIIGISLEAKAADNLYQDPKVTDPLRYYYLSILVGDGTPENKYRPAVADYASTWGMFDLRADCTKADGYCIAYTDNIYPITGDARISVLSTGMTLNDTMDVARVSNLNTTLGIKAAGATFPELINNIATKEAHSLKINPLAPEIDGKVRLRLGGQIYGDAPIEKTHSTITESFNKADNTVLGPDLSWTEPDGTSWAVVSNVASIGGYTSQTAYPSNNMSTVNHYAQAKIPVLYRGGSVVDFYLAIRSNTNAIGTATFYMGTCARSGSSTYAHNIEKTVAGSWTLISANATAYSTNEVLYFEADGSALLLKKNGVEVNSASDSSITTGNYVRICYYSTYASNGINIDNFEASELELPPSIANAPSSEALGVLNSSSAYYAYGSAPSNPVVDGECTFTITNDGSITIDIDVKGTNFTGGTTVSLTSGAPGSNQVRMTVYYSGQNPASGVVLTTSDQAFYTGLAASGTKKCDFKFETGTLPTDGTQKTGTLTFTASAS